MSIFQKEVTDFDIKYAVTVAIFNLGRYLRRLKNTWDVSVYRNGLWPCYISQSEMNVNKTLKIRYMLYFGVANKNYESNARYN